LPFPFVELFLEEWWLAIFMARDIWRRENCMDAVNAYSIC